MIEIALVIRGASALLAIDAIEIRSNVIASAMIAIYSRVIPVIVTANANSLRNRRD